MRPLTTKFEDLTRALTSASDGDFKELAATRRGLILAPLLAASPAALLAYPAHAIDPAQTQVILPDQYQWKPALPSAPAKSVETVPVFGATDKPGPYVVLVKWHPGYMSAPHTYVTDRLCFVISGIWWALQNETLSSGAALIVLPNNGRPTGRARTGAITHTHAAKNMEHRMRRHAGQCGLPLVLIR